MAKIVIDPIIIENVKPCIDGGRYRIKRIVGEEVNVTADVFRDGHDIIWTLLKYREKGAKEWIELPMKHVENDMWAGTFIVDKNCIYEYTIESYTEWFLSWQDELGKKNGKLPDLNSELLEGIKIVKTARDKAKGNDKKSFDSIIKTMESNLEVENQSVAIETGLGEKLSSLMAKYPDRSVSSTYPTTLEVFCERRAARYAAWYEVFPRSQGTVEGQSGTFKDVERRLPEIQAMGFDVLYFPPIHPIGVTNRKGPNNTLVANPGDPGSPYAIGAKEGGHMAIHPELGTFEDFAHLVEEAAKYGLEIALDFAINCSPDHPYVKDHPDWFFKRPDGTIKFAENPPKKYEDIYPVNFYCDDYKNLWKEMRDIFLFWADKGVKTFRVDNPHTKPVAFWEWCIAEVKEQYPDVIFLSEAFTKPKMMKSLAKAGYQQSYTYFTWRNFKHEITEYLEELTQSEMKEYFTGNFFANTPDILPTILQEGGRPAFIMRGVLAGTLSSVYGIYAGFELCENEAVPGKEEYWYSEKYEYKVWDWDRPGNIKYFVTKVNEIRKNNPALQKYDNLRFHHTENENVLCYSKKDGDNIILCVVNLDPYQEHNSFIYVPIDEFGISEHETYQVHDLLHEEKHLWTGSKNYVVLDPAKDRGAHIFKIRKWSHHEEGFDYFI